MVEVVPVVVVGMLVELVVLELDLDLVGMVAVELLLVVEQEEDQVVLRDQNCKGALVKLLEVVQEIQQKVEVVEVPVGMVVAEVVTISAVRPKLLEAVEDLVM
jgi:hypothetical protein